MFRSIYISGTIKFVCLLSFISITTIESFMLVSVQVPHSSTASSLYHNKLVKVLLLKSSSTTTLIENKFSFKRSRKASSAWIQSPTSLLSSSSSSSTTSTTTNEDNKETTTCITTKTTNDEVLDEKDIEIRKQKNISYIQRLISNLETVLDQYIILSKKYSSNEYSATDSEQKVTLDTSNNYKNYDQIEQSKYIEQANNIFDLIVRQTTTGRSNSSTIQSYDDYHTSLVQKACQMMNNVGIVPMATTNNTTTRTTESFLVNNESKISTSGVNNSNKILGKTDQEHRTIEALERQKWEELRKQDAAAVKSGKQSIFDRKQINTNNKPTNSIIDDGNNIAMDPKTYKVYQDKTNLQNRLNNNNNQKLGLSTTSPNQEIDNNRQNNNSDNNSKDAATIVSEYITKTGQVYDNFNNGQLLGIGGLDNVLQQIKRRIYIPLSSPPILLQQLGIRPVRGLLLYGKSGNGKTLIAQTIGQLLSPLRPITIVSGPEIMDKFVGSSEQKLRDIFDNPPYIYDQYKNITGTTSTIINQAALHVIIMDEFDAIARARGGRDGAGDQGDAGVARDSVVNQLLAKMDGVAPLVVPTLVIGLTNRRSLIDKALLRPGRFEVHIEIPSPKTIEQRVSILNVHMKHMYTSGRLLVQDAPVNTPAHAQLLPVVNVGSNNNVNVNNDINNNNNIKTYDELLHSIAVETDGFSGAAIAAIARAAASHALERAVESYSMTQDDPNISLMKSCVVTQIDVDAALVDVRSGLSDSDWTEDEMTTTKTNEDEVTTTKSNEDDENTNNSTVTDSVLGN